MTRPITLLIFTIIILFRNVSLAQDGPKPSKSKASEKDIQTLTIQSLDSKSQKLYIMPNYPNHILRISCMKDTISLLDYWGVPPDVEVLNKNFIKIEYAVRGGSNVGFRNMMILCVNGNKLFETMHVSSYANFEYCDREGTYTIKTALKGNNKSDYKLNIYVHDYVKSTSNPKENYNYNNQSILSFDANENVFYSIKGDLYGDFKMLRKRPNKKSKQKIRGNFPVIILGKNSYYFLNGRWHELETASVLDEF